MAQYKVPQDVEAEDKLLGPFTFRQFIYLIIAIIFVAIAWGLFNLFPLLGIFPLPISIFFLILSLPIKKDQPMEVYLSAVIHFYLQPNRRLWMPGQAETLIKITAPKIIEQQRFKDITEEEATNRLSFLSEIIDSEGHAIRGSDHPLKNEYLEEAETATDILDENSNPFLNQKILEDENNRKQQLLSNIQNSQYQQNNYSQQTTSHTAQTPISADPISMQKMAELANTTDLSIDSISREANRLTQTDNRIEAENNAFKLQQIRNQIDDLSYQQQLQLQKQAQLQATYQFQQPPQISQPQPIQSQLTQPQQFQQPAPLQSQLPPQPQLEHPVYSQSAIESSPIQPPTQNNNPYAPPQAIFSVRDK